MGSENDLIRAGNPEGLLVHFGCLNQRCSNIFEEFVKDAVFDTLSDRDFDGIGYAETPVECSDCGDEYVVTVLATIAGKEVSLKGFPDVHVDFQDYKFEQEYDEFLFAYEPDDPFGVYNDTIVELNNLQHGSTIMASAVPAFNKMICLQHIIAVEAYLSDRLIKIVTQDNDKLIALVGATAALREQKPKFIDIAKQPDFVLNTTKDYLQRFSFHDLASVSAFYRAVLKIGLFENEDNEKEMLQIIKMRHDLVHRSGRDNDGIDVSIDDDDITRLQNLMMDLVGRVETAYGTYLSDRAFSKKF